MLNYLPERNLPDTRNLIWLASSVTRAFSLSPNGRCVKGVAAAGEIYSLPFPGAGLLPRLASPPRHSPSPAALEPRNTQPEAQKRRPLNPVRWSAAAVIRAPEETSTVVEMPEG